MEPEEFLGVDHGEDQIETGSVATEQQMVEPEKFLGVDQREDQIEAGSVATEQQIGGAGGFPRRRPRGRPN